MQNIIHLAPIFGRVYSWALPRFSGSTLRPLLGLAIGGVLFAALSLKWPLAAGAIPAGPTSLWVADRDANELIGLDRDVFVQQKVALRSPVKLAPKFGGMWVVSAIEANPIGLHDLKRLGAGGGLLNVPGGSGLGPLIDLETAPMGAALCIEMGLFGKPTRLLRAGASAGAALVELGIHTGALSIMGQVVLSGGNPAQAIESVLVGDEFGLLTRYGLNGAVLAQVTLGGQLADLAPGPGGLVFALDLTGGGRVFCLDAALATIWSVTTNLAAEQFSPVPGEERLWLVDSTEPLARRYGPGGVLELEVQLPASDATSVLAQKGGGALISVPGALLHLGPSGTILPGQGGFNYLVDIAAQK